MSRRYFPNNPHAVLFYQKNSKKKARTNTLKFIKWILFLIGENEFHSLLVVNHDNTESDAKMNDRFD